MLKYFKLDESVDEPKFATIDSACFDVCAYFAKDNTIIAGQEPPLVVVYNMNNKKEERECKFWPKEKNDMCVGIDIYPGERVLIPTGLIFNIPFGYSVRLHTRSSISLKRGLIMSNSEGIIDSDYYHQTYVMLYNASADEVRVWQGERIAQGELVKTLDYNIKETEIMPEQTTNRVGGFGSTGV